MTTTPITRFTPFARAIPIVPAALLIVAALFVAAAIIADGSSGRALNGVGAVVWLAGSGLLFGSLGRSNVNWPAAAVGVVVALVLVLGVRPHEFHEAIAGFFAAGLLAAAAGRERPIAWSLLVPALWLPLHLLFGVLPALLDRAAGVRSEPPPTPALLPLSMIVAAVLGGAVVAALDARRQPLGPSNA